MSHVDTEQDAGDCVDTQQSPRTGDIEATDVIGAVAMLLPWLGGILGLCEGFAYLAIMPGLGVLASGCLVLLGIGSGVVARASLVSLAIPTAQASPVIDPVIYQSEIDQSGQSDVGQTARQRGLRRNAVLFAACSILAGTNLTLRLGGVDPTISTGLSLLLAGIILVAARGRRRLTAISPRQKDLRPPIGVY